ncbi:hypothetical protein TNCV_4031521 [Trichonephila clavipes]|nr:hypothetical protein TNCV_4031521 [Trichonephila clavipes]
MLGRQSAALSHPPSSITELKRALQEAWNRLSPQLIHYLIAKDTSSSKKYQISVNGGSLGRQMISQRIAKEYLKKNRQISVDAHIDTSTVHRLWQSWLKQGNVASLRNVGAATMKSARVDHPLTSGESFANYFFSLFVAHTCAGYS